MVQETGPRLRVVLLGRGNAAAVDVAKDVRVLFVGQVSGLTKIAKQLPFTGPAGRWLDGWFFEAAVSRAMIYLSALARCLTKKREVAGTKCLPERCSSAAGRTCCANSSSCGPR
jgi:uracil-DNA glycosylase